MSFTDTYSIQAARFLAQQVENLEYLSVNGDLHLPPELRLVGVLNLQVISDIVDVVLVPPVKTGRYVLV
jgi:hypothetical protein